MKPSFIAFILWLSLAFLSLYANDIPSTAPAYTTMRQQVNRLLQTAKNNPSATDKTWIELKKIQSVLNLKNLSQPTIENLSLENEILHYRLEMLAHDIKNLDSELVQLESAHQNKTLTDTDYAKEKERLLFLKYYAHKELIEYRRIIDRNNAVLIKLTQSSGSM